MSDLMNPLDAELLRKIGITSDEITDDPGLVNQLRTAGKADEAAALERLRQQVGGNAAKANTAEQEINRAGVTTTAQMLGKNNISSGYGVRTRK